jgi:hypothetical protein
MEDMFKSLFEKARVRLGIGTLEARVKTLEGELATTKATLSAIQENNKELLEGEAKRVHDMLVQGLRRG